MTGFAAAPPPPPGAQAASNMLASTSTVSKAYERLDILPPPNILVILRLPRHTAGLTLPVDKTKACRHHLLWLEVVKSPFSKEPEKTLLWGKSFSRLKNGRLLISQGYLTILVTTNSK